MSEKKVLTSDEVKDIEEKNANALNSIAARLQQGSRVVPPKNPYKFNQDLKKFLLRNTLSCNATNCLVWTYYIAAATEFNVRMFEAKTPMTSYTDAKDQEADAKLDGDIPDDAKEKEVTSEMWEFTKAVMPKAGLHLYELCAAWQVSALDERNVESYYKSAGMTVTVATVLKVLPYYAAIIPRISGTDGFVQAVTSSDWLKYHTTATSTPALVDLMIRGVEGFYPISNEWRGFVASALRKPWDKKLSELIPKNLIAIAYTYLEVMGRLPNNWYQGIKAVAQTDSITLGKWRNIFNRFRSLAAKLDQINQAEDVKMLTALGKSEGLYLSYDKQELTEEEREMLNPTPEPQERKEEPAKNV